MPTPPDPRSATGIVTFGMPNALPRVAEPDEHRIQFTDVFSTTKGHHTFKFGGDINNVHEIMINLFQGGGIYSYSGTQQQRELPVLGAGRLRRPAGNTDPLCGVSLHQLRPDGRRHEHGCRTQGKDDFYMNMLDGFAEDTWKITPNFTLTAGVR